MKSTKITVLTCLLLIMTASVNVAADAIDRVIESAIEGGFSEIERQMIDRYYANQHRQHSSYDSEHEGRSGTGTKHKDKKAKGKNKDKKKMPPGLARKDQLPPGLQRQYQRNGQLPPGLAKRELPTDLNASLPAINRGLERVVVDTDVLLVETATGMVRDILYDIVK